MKIGLGSDHAAVELKNCLLEHLRERGFDCVDFGAASPEDRVDYPVPGRKVAEAVMLGKLDRGILVCGTGVGISLAANKVPGIRAGVCSEPYTAKMIVEHNDCQILAMGARVVGAELGKMICDAFVDARFQEGRHARRINMIRQIEQEYNKSAIELTSIIK